MVQAISRGDAQRLAVLAIEFDKIGCDDAGVADRGAPFECPGYSEIENEIVTIACESRRRSRRCLDRADSTNERSYRVGQSDTRSFELRGADRENAHLTEFQ